MMLKERKSRRGIILVLVLVVIAILAAAAMGFSELMLDEHRAAITSSRQDQARSFAESGVEVAAQFLNRDPSDQTQAGGIYDNSSRFADQLVADEAMPQDRGHFSVVAPKSDDGVTISGVRYGPQDESTRINLAALMAFDQSSGSAGVSEPAEGNTYAHIMLMGLPGMTDDVADAILEWIDPSGKQRPNGPGAQYYASLTPPYAERNGTPVSIEELLLVKGVTPELLYGQDAAKMGLSSSASADSGSIAGVDNSNGQMDHGWAAYLTLWSAEDNIKSDGTPKINLNDPDLKSLYDTLTDALDEESAEFIVAYRLGGKGPADATGHLDLTKLSQSGSGSSSGGSAGGGGLTGSVQIKNLLELSSGTAYLTVSPSGSTTTPSAPTGPGAPVGPGAPIGPGNNGVYLNGDRGIYAVDRGEVWELPVPIGAVPLDGMFDTSTWPRALVRSAAIGTMSRRPQTFVPSTPRPWRRAILIGLNPIAQFGGGGRGGSEGNGNGNGGGGRGGAGGGGNGFGGGAGFGGGGGGRGGAGRGGEGGTGRGGAGRGGEGGGDRGGAGRGGEGGGGRGGAGRGGEGGGGRGGAEPGGGAGRGGAEPGGRGRGGAGTGGGRGRGGNGRGRGRGGNGRGQGRGRGGNGRGRGGNGRGQGGRRGQGQGKSIVVPNPFSPQSGTMQTNLPKLFANCSTNAYQSMAGRININQASRVVLLCIPAINANPDLADAIISQRTQDPAQQSDVDQCPAWPLIRGIVPLATMQQLLPYVNAGGSVYRADVIGSFEKGGASARVEAIIDATQNPSRIVFWNDMSHLQGGFPVEPPPGGSAGGTSGGTAGK